jgi:nitrite reductase/ring-hydroxylating ferredoxin subunit
MAEAVDVCEEWSVEPGTVRRVVVGGKRLAVYHVGDAFHVSDDTCTHGFASLSDGTLEGHVITCPWHGGAFDVRTGLPVAAPCTEPLAVYACEVREGMVRIRLNRP